MLGDLGRPLLIGREAQRAAWPAAAWPAAASPAAFLAVDEPEPGGEAGAAYSPWRGDPAVPAIVYFTSGSTGRPKGVLVPQPRHRAAGARRQRLPPLRPGRGGGPRLERFVRRLAARNLGRPAERRAGGDRRPGPLLAPEKLAAFRDEAVTTMWQTAAFFHQNVRTSPELFDPLRAIFFGGERVDPESVRLLLRRQAAHGKGPALYNDYGPTETTCFALVSRVEHLAEDAVSVPIGRPIAATGAYVLDGRGQLAPLGGIGELALGGPALSPGYLARPGLTAEKFVPDPFSGVPGARLYKTGDLVRILPSGEIDFVGRADHQVKLRGFRIELAEIEAALLATPGVAQALVLLREDQPGDKRLAAYWSGPAELGREPLLASLRERLPEFMLPSDFVELAALPLSANGKVDRRALPMPLRDEAGGEGRNPPQGTFEMGIAVVWAEVLDRFPIFREDHFFELGGHSLIATWLRARLADWLGTEAPLRLLFDAPQLADFAAALRAHLAASEAGRQRLAELDLLDQRRRGRRRAGGPGAEPGRDPGWRRSRRASRRRFPSPRSGMWLLDALEPGGQAYHMPFQLELRGPLDPAVLEAALRLLVLRHPALRTTFGAVAGVPWQRVAPPGFDLLVDDLRAVPAAAREAAAAASAAALLACSASRPGRFFRARLLRLEGQEWRLVFCFHHIAFDGWSTGIFFRELGVLLGELGAGRQPALPELPLAYTDYAAWQRATFEGEKPARELA